MALQALRPLIPTVLFCPLAAASTSALLSCWAWGPRSSLREMDVHPSAVLAHAGLGRRFLLT